MGEPAAPETATEDLSAGSSRARPGTVRDLLRYFLALGAVGFGGPIALAGYMQRDLVERRGWITRKDYLDGLALAQLAPGPLAAQLAIYLGWAKGGLTGASGVALAFVLPPFLMVLGLSALYVRTGQMPWIPSAFYGVGAAVIAIVGRSAVGLMRMTLGRSPLLWALCALSAVATAWAQTELVWLFLGSGVIAMAIRGGTPRPPPTAAGLALAPGALAASTASGLDLWTLPWPLLGKLFVYFTEAGTLVFGSGLAIVPFLHADLVGPLGWLTERQFLDAVAIAMITPGPVVIAVAFIGYLVAGAAGAAVSTLGVLLPSYLFMVLPAPTFHRWSDNRRVRAFVEGVTAAASGAIAAATLLLARRALPDLPAATIALAALLLLTLAKRLPDPLVILAAAVAGLAIHRP